MGLIYIRAEGLAEGFLASEESNRWKSTSILLRGSNASTEAESDGSDERRRKEHWRVFWKGLRNPLHSPTLSRLNSLGVTYH